ncbi:hypothetical protein CDAR_619561 [Caerostris darwini]|uniref:Uncharacterized protein n=1 Tax=Caerostris darwini TaxID=1538125 RepID=A0AAV4QS93_9ARAC|nr:hypothetical protein CDAR_619561 [Caerostris darwini]
MERMDNISASERNVENISSNVPQEVEIIFIPREVEVEEDEDIYYGRSWSPCDKGIIYLAVGMMTMEIYLLFTFQYKAIVNTIPYHVFIISLMLMLRCIYILAKLRRPFVIIHPPFADGIALRFKGNSNCTNQSEMEESSV